MINDTELARRICLAYHPFLGQVQPAPCAAHLRMARSVHVLTTAIGRPALTVILNAAADNMKADIVELVSEAELAKADGERVAEEERELGAFDAAAMPA